MQLQDMYPVIVTPHHKECRDFYARWFGSAVVFEAPPGPEVFNGTGLFLTFQVSDAAAEFSRLERAGATFAYALRDEPWGQRRFALRDPSGCWVDVVEHTEAAPGFWDPFVS